ncbi:hypothetical protein CVT24_004320 [Panaeolus cyanescens]|uniref:Major facilitator superfamily (MFS) profile domain-containing protein n=1 Tax=Panaeolus cyanescens TaxID=181874 RepID=A0A409VAB3_9AGAR|nr:hypothetical protein CVT24_004320 [Panaeolus cyanescens]
MAHVQDKETSTMPAESPLASTPEPSREINDRFTKNEKWFIVSLTAAVGLFSPLTANIYFPAIPTLSQAFHKPTELINLTVTMYMILQGVAPMVWGPLSDNVGRRPTSAGCMIILALSCVGLALVPTSAFWLLMLLRCLQAAGSASTIAIGAGVIGDISTRAERGGFFGLFTIGPMVGPTIGPVIGGALSDHLGWRSIFWFLCISASMCLLMIVVFQPETLKTLSDAGRRPILHRPIVPLIGRNKQTSNEMTTTATTRRASKNPFRIFLNFDVDILLIISALSCAVFYGVITTISTLFVKAYPFLSETDIGLCFLAIGGGMTVGSVLTGRVLDREYQHFKQRAEKCSTEKGSETSFDITREENFPLERVRLLRLCAVHNRLLNK